MSPRRPDQLTDHGKEGRQHDQRDQDTRRFAPGGTLIGHPRVQMARRIEAGAGSIDIELRRPRTRCRPQADAQRETEPRAIHATRSTRRITSSNLAPAREQPINHVAGNAVCGTVPRFAREPRYRRRRDSRQNSARTPSPAPARRRSRLDDDRTQRKPSVITTTRNVGTSRDEDDHRADPTTTDIAADWTCDDRTPSDRKK